MPCWATRLDASLASSSPRLPVTDPNSEWDCHMSLGLGIYDQAGEVLIANGGRVKSGSGVIGFSSGSQQSLVTVSGVGSVWTNTGALMLGVNGFDNQLQVKAGGTVYSERSVIGNAAAADNNLWIEGGARVDAGILCVGVTNSASNNVIYVQPNGLLTGEGVLQLRRVNNHGVPKAWLVDNGWTNDFDAAALADPDSDRVPTWQEYFAGTDPNDAASVFQCLEISQDFSPMLGTVLRWQPVAGCLYAVDCSTNRPAPLWWELTNQLPATVNSWTDIVTQAGNGLYRLRAMRE